MHSSALFTDAGRGDADALLYIYNVQCTPDSCRGYSISTLVTLSVHKD